MNWDEYCDKNRFYYPIKTSCEDVTAFDISRVYPLQQDNVKAAYNAIKDFDCIKRVVVFGSSITMKCTEHSDLDLCIELKNPGNVEDMCKVGAAIRDAVDCNVDILWRESLTIESPVLFTIRKGLIIYEQSS